jgi:hypothetical protein
MGVAYELSKVGQLLSRRLGRVGGGGGRGKRNEEQKLTVPFPIPRTSNCLLLTTSAATIANVVLTAPIPHENTNDVLNGEVGFIKRRYASK